MNGSAPKIQRHGFLPAEIKLFNDRAVSSSSALGRKQIKIDGSKYNKIKVNVWGEIMSYT